MIRRKQDVVRHDEPFPTTLRKFRHLTFASRNGLLSGMSSARRTVPPKHIPPLVKTIHDTATLRDLLPEPFPSSYERILAIPRLAPASCEVELLWSCSLLAAHAERLNAFVAARSEIEDHVLASRWKEGEKCLSEIESTYGFSVWSIGTRLQILQQSEGLKAQKDYLEQVLSTEGASGVLGYVAYLLSVRAEENTSLETLHIEVDDLVQGTPAGDLARFYVLPWEPAGLVSTHSLLNANVSACAIDRLHNVVYCLQLHLTREGANGRALAAAALTVLGGIQEPSLDRLRTIVGLTQDVPPIDLDGLRALDAYTQGRYDEVPLRPDFVDLYARARLFSANVRPPSDRTTDYITWVLGEAYVGATDGLKVHDELSRAVLVLGTHPLALHIAAALSRQQGVRPIRHQPGEVQLLAAIAGCTVNPWTIDLLRSAGIHRNQAPLEAFSTSPTFALHYAIDAHEGGDSIRRLAIPEYRQRLYVGHWHLKNHRFYEAAQMYKSAGECEIPYVRVQAAIGHFQALAALQDDAGSIALYVRHCLEFPSSQSKFNVEPVLERALEDPVLSATVQLAVALHIAWRYGAANWGVTISDVLENILDSYGVRTPVQLLSSPALPDGDVRIYFLAHVCSLRILEDTTRFGTLNEVEAERIRICQVLVELDPIEADIYSREIRTITRDARAAQLLQQVQSNYIFVDEDGLKESVGPHLRVLFDRFLSLSRAPEVNYRSENISRQLFRLLDKGDDPELKNLRLPTSEREALFSNLVNTFVVNFATNSAFGLDPHLSTSIRHGTFEGPLISALAGNDLLAPTGPDGESVLPERWQSEIPTDRHEKVRRALGKFSSRVQALIEEWTKGLLHIWHPETASTGLFNFTTNALERQALMDTVNLDTTFEELWLRLSAHCWGKIESSMDVIKARIRSELLKQLHGALDALVATLDDKPTVTTSSLRDSIVRAQLRLQTAVEDISGWFVRSESTQREDFEIEWVFDVARRQIHNCYVRAAVVYNERYETSRKISGRNFDGLVEVCFILLQNAVRHSHLNALKVGIAVEPVGEGMRIAVQSDISPEVDLAALHQVATEAARRYNRESAMKRTRSEGGSGLSKVWRILEHDLKVKHEVELAILDEPRLFRVSLLIDDLWRST